MSGNFILFARFSLSKEKFSGFLIWNFRLFYQILLWLLWRRIDSFVTRFLLNREIKRCQRKERNWLSFANLTQRHLFTLFLEKKFLLSNAGHIVDFHLKLLLSVKYVSHSVDSIQLDLLVFHSWFFAKDLLANFLFCQFHFLD